MSAVAAVTVPRRNTIATDEPNHTNDKRDDNQGQMIMLNAPPPQPPIMPQSWPYPHIIAQLPRSDHLIGID